MAEKILHETNSKTSNISLEIIAKATTEQFILILRIRFITVIILIIIDIFIIVIIIVIAILYIFPYNS